MREVQIPQYLMRFVNPVTRTLEWSYPFRQFFFSIWFYIPKKIREKNFTRLTIEVEECGALDYNWFKMLRFNFEYWNRLVCFIKGHTEPFRGYCTNCGKRNE